MKNQNNRIELEEFKRAIIGLEKVFSENTDKLTKLDSIVGDGDHGENMKRGFSSVADLLRDKSFEDYSDLFQNVGTELIKSIGGAAGPIFGSFFLGMKKEVHDKSKITLTDLINCFASGLDMVKERGGAELGDKTMVDSLEPAVKELKKEMAKGSPDCGCFRSASKKAEAGMVRTREMKSRKGRSKFSGDRSKGHQDPGATSMKLIIEHFYRFLCE